MTSHNKAAVLSRRADRRLALMCAIAITAQTYQFWLAGHGILSYARAILPFASEAQSIIGALAEVGILLAALRAPRLLQPRPLLICTILCCATGATLLEIEPATPHAILLGLAARRAGLIFGFYLIGISLSKITNTRLVAASTSAAVILATCIATVAPAPAFRISVLLDALLTIVCIAPTWETAEQTIKDIASSPGVEVRALTNPRSFLLPNNQVFLLMFIFSVAVGFGSVLRMDSLAPLTSNLSIFMLIGSVTLFLLAPSRREDALFTTSILLVAAGFLAAPITGLGVGVANAFLYAGRLAFSVLAWAALSSLCARNPAGSMMVLACGEFANDTGALIGGGIGNLCNTLLVDQPQIAAVLTSCVVLFMLAYALTGLRTFSFAATIHAVEPAGPMPLPNSAEERRKPLDSACQRLSTQYGLTAREQEVLGLLARGHNGYHIRDELSLSYNTVKTHAKHVYAKLGVHSQQDVIDIVEREAALGNAANPAPQRARRSSA
ncbi:MAG: helix-turn-helix transcriptional regulator [Coriobacteriia bacterium]|nr:helix-turn-helix transcriptional regulator [Coriobacteriia bacterium]MBS5478115.1 helix-turn-helix transcriptional regulator [Coriobacteriia bacterium]